MNTSLKVRILLFILSVCFTGTAITVNNFYDREEILLVEGSTIEKNLHKKEAEVKAFLSDSLLFSSLVDIHQNEALAQKLIVEYGKEKQIYIYTYSNNELSFWGSNIIVPKTDVGVSLGSSIIAWDNGWYLAFKKSEGGFSVVCLIPIKEDFLLDNSYLESKFSKELINSNNLEVAKFKDNDVFNLRDSDGKYLLSLKLSSQFRTYFSKLEFLMWIFAMISATIFMTVVCQWIANKGWVKLSILVFAGYFFIIRYLDLSLQIISNRFYGGVFDPTNYASSFFFPSLGALFLNILAITWLVFYIYSYRYKLQFNRKSLTRFQSILIFIGSGILIYLFCLLIVEVFRGLISNSSINFDVTNILKLNLYSWIGVVSLCISLLNLYLVIEILFVVTLKLRISSKLRIWLFVGIVAVLFFAKLISGDLSVSFFLLTFILSLRIWFVNEKRKFHLAAYVAILLLFAAIASLKQGAFQEEKLEAQQVLALQKLESADDPNAVLLFLDIEKRISQYSELINYINYPALYDFQLVNESFRKEYFGGYLSRYDFYGYLFDESGNSNDSLAIAKLDYFKNRVIEGSRKVSANFYRLNDEIGYLNYFALLPIEYEDQNIGLYLIELNNKALGRRSVFPEILIEGNMEVSDNLEKYSYAFYKEGKLQTQSGEFLYHQTDEEFPHDEMYSKVKGKKNYTHLIYSPDKSATIILSSQNRNWWIQLASLSFLFLVFLVFSIFVYAFRWFFRIVRDYDFNFRNLRWAVMISQNRILYSTRIQAFVVLAVVFTLVIAGVITYVNLSLQYRKQQERSAISQVIQLAGSLEARMFKKGYVNRNTLNEQEFNLVAETNASDLNLYGINGELIYSTQPKIYDLGLTSRYIHSDAWLYLNNYQREEYFQREDIGNLNYLVSYAAIKNDDKQTIAYLSLPFFSNQKELDSQLGLLLNTLINIYAFVIVALGLFAVFVANQITAPLFLVQRSLARTKIGRNNEPIFWKRNDEIGSLIKEYNNMIIALDYNASQIMRSERESAWHEMAKQVAHEIKNPLTPLRLGVQLLNRSYREKDPDFDKKFERFSKSFIEQIESLNHIASEFANFAKMPDTVLIDLNVVEVIEQAISIYAENKSIQIKLEIKDPSEEIVIHGDRDQLLRAFNNLIKNAIEAIVKGRTCVITIKIKSLISGFVSIDIEDNGKGIDMNVREKIFQPNFTTKSSGTGLGLAFVKQTVKTIGGTIRYKTETMVGTTFYILIPLKGHNL